MTADQSRSSPYDELDAAIVKAIQGGRVRFYQIWPYVIMLAQPHVTGRYSGPDRVVDRRLQALRKQRKITYWGGKWSVL